MPSSENWSKWWRRFLDIGPDEAPSAIDFLRQRYVEEMQRIERFKQHAAKMHYPQYREKFLRMAQENSHHAERIGAKIVALGGALPDVAERHLTDANNWQSLATALDEENRAAERLPGQLRGIESAHPDIAKLLQQIAQEQDNHREQLRGMLMRSDPFAQSLA